MKALAPMEPRSVPDTQACAARWLGPHRRVCRALEILPTAAVWLMITSPVWAAIMVPKFFGYFMILFSLYWFWKSAWFAGGVLAGYFRIRSAERRDWRTEAFAWPGVDRIRHIVAIPTYGESEEILAATLHDVAAQDYPLDCVSVVLAFEARDQAAPARAERLAARFGSLFDQLLVTFHPDLPGEVKGKSSNLGWVGVRVQEELIASGKLESDNLLITVLDADSRLHHRYLAALTQHVLSHPDGLFHIFQPAILFYANHWRLPAPLRALNSVYSLWELARLLPEYRLVTQSTYSLSWRAAETVHFWDVDVVPEDSHMFFKVLGHFGRRVKVRPIYLPVYADAAEGSTVWRSVVNSYQQIRRWAWGVSDIPYVIFSLRRAPAIPWWMRIGRVVWYVEEHLMWPSHWFLVTLAGMIPPMLNPDYARSALGLWQAHLSSAIMGACLPCLLVVIVVDWRLRPRHPDGENIVTAAWGLVGFATLPFGDLLLSTLPALDAHTRLLFGRYLQYTVTEKVSPAARRLAPRPMPKRLALGPLGYLFQNGPQAPSSPTAMTDSVLLAFRDLR